MTMTKCPHCRRVQFTHPRVLETRIGCLNRQCQEEFVAKEFHRSMPWFSRLALSGLCAVSVYFVVEWTQKNWPAFSQWLPI